MKREKPKTYNNATVTDLKRHITGITEAKWNPTNEEFHQCNDRIEEVLRHLSGLDMKEEGELIPVHYRWIHLILAEYFTAMRLLSAIINNETDKKIILKRCISYAEKGTEKEI